VDNKDNLWIGTSQWVSIYIPEDDTFRTYTSNVGIINDNILDISFYGKEIWLGTSGGIAKWVLKE
jgi:ligand-binding sensor domain-containing protein